MWHSYVFSSSEDRPNDIFSIVSNNIRLPGKQAQRSHICLTFGKLSKSSQTFKICQTGGYGRKGSQYLLQTQSSPQGQLAGNFLVINSLTWPRVLLFDPKPPSDIYVFDIVQMSKVVKKGEPACTNRG